MLPTERSQVRWKNQAQNRGCVKMPRLMVSAVEEKQEALYGPAVRRNDRGSPRAEPLSKASTSSLLHPRTFV